jgi:predicted transposase YbfD/YdcC
MHGDGSVIAQTRVDEKTNEIKSVRPLLDDVNIEGAVVTGDAMFAQRAVAEYLVEEKNADYLFTVKDNQPTLRANIENMCLESLSPSGRRKD